MRLWSLELDSRDCNLSSGEECFVTPTQSFFTSTQHLIELSRFDHWPWPMWQWPYHYIGFRHKLAERTNERTNEAVAQKLGPLLPLSLHPSCPHSAVVPKSKSLPTSESRRDRIPLTCGDMAEDKGRAQLLQTSPLTGTPSGISKKCHCKKKAPYCVTVTRHF